MPIAPQLKALITEVSALEARAENQANMLDSTFDLHNAITDWATNTEHSDAAMEVMAILEQFVRPLNSRQTTAA